MTTAFDTIVAFVCAIALLLGLWLVLMAGSVVVWEVMRRWSSAHIEARALRSGMPSAPRLE